MKQSLWFLSHYHSYPYGGWWGALLGRDITFNHFSILGLRKKVKAVFLLTEVPLTCSGHLNALCPKRCYDLPSYSPYLGKQHTKHWSPAWSLSHLLCSTCQQQPHPTLSSSISSSLFPPSLPLAIPGTGLTYTQHPHLCPQPGEHKSNFIVNPQRHSASAKPKPEVRQRDPQESRLLCGGPMSQHATQRPWASRTCPLSCLSCHLL